MRCLYSSDLHGNAWIYERLFAAASAPDVGALLLGGDLSPLEPPLDVMIERQREFWTDFLRPRCRALVDAGKRVLLIPGNDDLRIHDDRLREADEEGAWELVDDRTTTLGGFRLVGCSTIALTPFILKDREAYDLEVGRSRHGDVVDLRDANALFTGSAEPSRFDLTLADRLESLLSESAAGEPSILMAHCPPCDTKIDVLYDGRHVGSEAVRRAIERYQPALGLHGHIHESPSMPGGDWIDRIGATIVVNPGSSHHHRERASLHLVSFDTEDIGGTIRYDRL
ncbi:MAG: metallophosphoesterase family protein [Candidatus Binatia bacterium]